jgi:hypothetical protein
MVQSQDPPALLGWVPIPAHQASSRSTGAPHSPNLTLPGYQMLVWGTGQPGRPGGLPFSQLEISLGCAFEIGWYTWCMAREYDQGW